MKRSLLFFALASCLNVFSQNVGIGTNDPKSKLDINGSLSLREGPVLTLANGGASGGVNDNVSLPDMATGGKASFYRIAGPTAAFSVYGIQPVTGADGQMVTLVNTTSNVMTLKNNASSVAANGFKTLTNSDMVSVAGNSSITIQYNKTDSRWYVTGSQNYVVTTGTISTGDITTTNSAINMTNNTGRLVGTSAMTIDVATNALNQKGLVPGPTGGNGNQVWGTDASGNPAWQKVNNNQLTSNSVTVSPGTGMSGGGTVALGGTITLTNTGDTDPSNDITNSTSATGDLTGTYPGPTVAKIRNTTVSSTAPTNGQVLKYNSGSTQWEPSTDNAGTGTVTSVATGAGLTGGPITTSGTISIPNSGVTNAMLANSTITLNNGTGTTVTGSPVSLGGSATVNLTNTGVGAGSYTNANITVDAQGRITTASNGTAGTVTGVTASNGLTATGTTSVDIKLGGTITNANTTITEATAGNNLTINNTDATNADNIGDLVINRAKSAGLGGTLTLRNTGTAATGSAAAMAFELDNSTAFDNAGTNASNAEIRGQITGTGNGASLIFSNWSGSAEVERMRLSHDGTMGINNNMATNTGAMISITPTGGNWNEGIEINPSSGGYNAVLFRQTANSITNSWFAGKLANNSFSVMRQSLTGMVGTSRVDAPLEITTTGTALFGGSVGIGTSTINTKLDVNGQIGVGVRTPVGTTTTTPNWGNAVIFSGGTGMNAAYDSDNSDPLWMSRYNAGDNISELRAIIGDDPTNGNDKFVIGAMLGTPNYAIAGGTWTPRFYFQANGNFGIGNASAAYPLDVTGDINTTTGYRVSGTAANGTYLRGNGSQYVSSTIQASDLPSLTGTYVDLTNTQTAGGAKTWTNAATFNNKITMADYGTTGSINLQIGDDTYFTDVDVSNQLGLYGLGNSAEGGLRLGSGGPLLYGKSAGLGIGTLTPSTTLHLVASAPTGTLYGIQAGTTATLESNTNNYITFRNTVDNGTYAGLIFQDNNMGGYIAFRECCGGTNPDNMIYGSYTDHVFQNGTTDGVDAKAETMRIKQNGNVGIGVAAPSYKLQVNGDIYANGGWLRVAGSQGLYFETYGGGWYMTDATYIRTYNGKTLYAQSGLVTSGTASTLYGTNASIYANQLNIAGGGIMVSDDGGFFDYNDGPVTFNGSTGLRIAGASGVGSSGAWLRIAALSGGGTIKSVYVDNNGQLSSGCPSGFWAVAGGHICMEAGSLKGPSTMWVAIANCKLVGPGSRVCEHNDFQQACGGGFAPYGNSPGWYGDHGVASGGNWDDEFGTWNSASCADNNDGPAQDAAATGYYYRCCY